MSSTYAAETLAEFCTGLNWASFDPQIQTAAKSLTLDHVAVAIAGSVAESSRAAQRFVARYRGQGPAAVIGTDFTTAATWAALANGASAHAIEMDDVERASALHPGAPIVAAALAVGEEVQASGQAVLEAVVAGYEITMRVGQALNGSAAYQRGFHPTGVAGIFGAATAAARLLGLSAAQLTDVLGIACDMASGSLEYLTDGAWTKRLTPGWAAHAGITAAELGAAGFNGPASVFEGRMGLLHGYSGAGDPSLLLAGLGSDPLQISRVAIKPYGCCRWTHGVIDCMFQLRREGGFQPEDVESIRLGVLSVGKLLVAEPIEQKRVPKSIVDAQFSAPFAAAVAFVTGAAGLDQFTPATIANPTIGNLMARSDCYVAPAMDAEFPSRLPATVQVRLKDGRELKSRIDFPLGEPENPLTAEQLMDRFVDLSRAQLDRDDAEALGRKLLALDQVDDVRGLLSGSRSAVLA